MKRILFPSSISRTHREVSRCEVIISWKAKKSFCRLSKLLHPMKRAAKKAMPIETLEIISVNWLRQFNLVSKFADEISMAFIADFLWFFILAHPSEVLSLNENEPRKLIFSRASGRRFIMSLLESFVLVKPSKFILMVLHNLLLPWHPPRLL